MFGSIGRSVGGFFRDIVAPISLGILGGPTFGPLLAATYSGINTGIKTGSPLAGLGSAGLSLGLTSAFRGITAGQEAPASMSNIIQPGTGPISSGVASNIGLSPDMISQTAVPITGGVAGSPISSSIASNIGLSPDMVAKTSLPTITATTPTASTGIMDRLSNVGNIFDADKLKAGFVDTTLGQQSPGLKEFLPNIVTERTPLTVAGLGLGLQMAATPPPEPAPFGPIQSRRTTDLSKYGYKGPLDRGKYTYADPEDIAYGRVTPGSYGYLGAKEGGKIKAQGGGVMMQSGPYNPAVEKQKGTFRPTGSMVSPQAAPGISSIAQTQPMMSVSPQKIAGLAQPVAPTIPTTNVPMAQPQAPAPMPMPVPQPQQGGIEQQAQQLINDLPKKDISVNIDQIRQFIGLAEGGKVPTTEKEFARIGVYKRPEDYDSKKMNVGGEVPGMASQAPAGITGPSSTVDMSAVNYGKSTPGLRQRFDDEIIGVYENMFSNKGPLLGAAGRLIGQMMIDQQGDAMFKYAQDNNLLRGLGGTYQGPLQRGPYRYPSSAENLAMGKEDVSKIGYENVTYPGVENMAEGGEVESNQTLQENAFVIPADVVGHIGDGSSDAGAQRLQSYLGMNPQQYQAGGIMAGELQGPGGGMDDLIQTSIEGKRAAAVSPQEFVVPRDIVAELGQGSYDKGSNKLYALMRNVRKAKTGTTKQPAELTRGLGQLMRTAVA